MGMLDKILDVIDAPSNALQGLVVEGWQGAKKGLLQERDYDFEEAFSDEFRKENPEASYWLSGAANLVFDPLNLVGAGLFTKGAKGMSAASKAGADQFVEKGLRNQSAELLNSTPNYLPGFYSNNPLKKAKAVAIGAKQGFENWIDLNSSPKMKAFYQQYGINPAMLQSKRLIEEGVSDDRVAHELYSRLIHNAHINEQAGRKVAYPKEMLELKNRMFQSDYLKYGDNSYGKALSKDWIKDTKGFVSKDDLKFVNDSIGKLWKERSPKTGFIAKEFNTAPVSEIVIKAPDSRAFGRHFNDMKLRAQAMKNLGDLFSDTKMLNTHGNFKNSKELAGALSGKGFNVMKTDKDGVWINFSMKGSPIAEGGVNAMVKIKNDGKFMSVISDEYNFLETFGGSLPLQKRLVAITPPMLGDLKKSFNTQVFKGNEAEYAKHLNKKSTKEFSKIKSFQPNPLEGMISKKGTKKLYDDLLALEPDQALVDYHRNRLIRNKGMQQGMLSTLPETFGEED